MKLIQANETSWVNLDNLTTFLHNTNATKKSLVLCFGGENVRCDKEYIIPVLRKLEELNTSGEELPHGYE